MNNDGKDFEREVARVFQAQGYHTDIDDRGSGWQIDLIASKPDNFGHNLSLVVECKDYRTPVGVSKLSDLPDKVAHFARIGFNGYYIVARNGFTAQAKTLADHYDFVKLIDYRVILDPTRRLIDFSTSPL